MHGGGKRGERGVARVHEHQPFLREQLGEETGECPAPSDARTIMACEAGQVLLAARQAGQIAAERLEPFLDGCGQEAVGDRDPVVRDLEGERQRLVASASHVADGDLGGVVVLGLDPEHRRDRRVPLLGEPSCESDGRGGLVERLYRER
jgi:hypothetical protein